MIPIKYTVGDATNPQGSGRKIIAHVCNDVGAWGAGFVLALSAEACYPEEEYRYWHWQKGHNLPAELVLNPFELGQIQFASFDKPDVFVCNMIAQAGIGHDNGPAIRYEALRHCLRKLGTAAHAAQATVHMPRIGCGLAGGTWDQVQPIILQEISANNIEVTVYDLPDSNKADRDAWMRDEGPPKSGQMTTAGPTP